MSAEEGALLGCAFKAAKELLNWTRALWLSDVSERVKCDSVRKRSVLLRKHKCFAERRRTRHELAELSPAEDGGVPSGGEPDLAQRKTMLASSIPDPATSTLLGQNNFSTLRFKTKRSCQLLARNRKRQDSTLRLTCID
eukprot:2973128-Rhodomonas_salina.1